jgi:hypothetical protein
VQLLEAPADTIPARAVFARRVIPRPPIAPEAPPFIVWSADATGVEVDVGYRVPAPGRSRVREEEGEDVLRELSRIGYRLAEGPKHRFGRPSQVGLGCHRGGALAERQQEEGGGRSPFRKGGRRR